MWAIGDVQGCCDELKALVKKIDAIDPQSRLWFAGDLINRGPKSSETLRFIRSMGQRAICVLGNHDLHLLALATGVRKSASGDTMIEILSAPDAQDLIDWLRCQPLAHFADNFLLVHAGLFPSWTLNDALTHAQLVHQQLCSKHWQGAITQMYNKQTTDQIRFAVNALTRMRYLNADGQLDLQVKEDIQNAPAGLSPWYQDARILRLPFTVVYGHWSTQGLQMHPTTIGLDTGCVWGGALSAVHLPSRRLLQVAGQAYQAPG
jgi:bis(5'-nucleosyl)-tetraphosphatase (symmetrical)